MILALFALIAVAALAYVAVIHTGRADRYEATLREIAAWEGNGNGTARKLSRLAKEALK